MKGLIYRFKRCKLKPKQSQNGSKNPSKAQPNSLWFTAGHSSHSPSGLVVRMWLTTIVALGSLSQCMGGGLWQERWHAIGQLWTGFLLDQTDKIHADLMKGIGVCFVHYPMYSSCSKL